MNTHIQYLENKKIVIFTAETIPSFAGSGRHAFKLARFFEAKQAKTKLVCYNYNTALPKCEVIDDVAIRRIGYYNKGVLSKFFSFPNLLLGYFRQVIQADIIFVYGRYLLGYQLILLLGSFLGKKVIFRSTLLGCDDANALYQRNKLLWVINRGILRRTSCYWALNNTFHKYWFNKVGNKVPVLQQTQGIEKDLLALVNNKTIEANKPLRILSVGILIKRKGYLEIFKALAKINIPFKYTIVGQYEVDSAHRSSISEKEELKLIYSEGKKLLGDKVHFVGTVENIEKYYKEHDCLLHGAFQEGVPNTILESMAAGLPVVCRNLEGMQGEILEPGVNCLQFESVQDLINLFEQKIHSEELMRELAKNAHNKIKDCTFDNIIPMLVQCLFKNDE